MEGRYQGLKLEQESDSTSSGMLLDGVGLTLSGTQETLPSLQPERRGGVPLSTFFVEARTYVNKSTQAKEQKVDPISLLLPCYRQVWWQLRSTHLVLEYRGTTIEDRRIPRQSDLASILRLEAYGRWRFTHGDRDSPQGEKRR